MATKFDTKQAINPLI